MNMQERTLMKSIQRAWKSSSRKGNGRWVTSHALCHSLKPKPLEVKGNTNCFLVMLIILNMIPVLSIFIIYLSSVPWLVLGQFSHWGPSLSCWMLLSERLQWLSPASPRNTAAPLWAVALHLSTMKLTLGTFSSTTARLRRRKKQRRTMIL